MMDPRVSYGKSSPVAFFESRFFDLKYPYSIRHRTVMEEDIAQIHYATSLEVFLALNVKGAFSLEGKTFDLNGNEAFVVPPYSIHAVNLEPGQGEVYVLQLSYEALEPYIDLLQLLESSNRKIEARRIPDDQLSFIIKSLRALITNDNDIMRCINILLELIMGIATPGSFNTINAEPMLAFEASNEIQSVILWSMNNFRQTISLDEIAGIAGYSKSYFCTWFKKNTGLSYQTYINTLRINYACEVLRKTASVGVASESVGITNTSYFIQLFKKIKGCTPMQYLRPGNRGHIIAAQKS